MKNAGREGEPELKKNWNNKDTVKVQVEFSLEDMDMSGFQKGATISRPACSRRCPD